jgi:hypothetical protein
MKQIHMPDIDRKHHAGCAGKYPLTLARLQVPQSNRTVVRARVRVPLRLMRIKSHTNGRLFTSEKINGNTQRERITCMILPRYARVVDEYTWRASCREQCPSSSGRLRCRLTSTAATLPRNRVETIEPANIPRIKGERKYEQATWKSKMNRVTVITGQHPDGPRVAFELHNVHTPELHQLRHTP